MAATKRATIATIRKCGKAWQVQIKKKINGQEVRESDTFLTKGKAQAWATMREAELLDSCRKGLIVADKHTLYEALIRYLEEVTPTKRGAKREAVFIKKFINDIEFIGEPITNIKASHFSAFRDDLLKLVSASTVRRELTVLSSIYSKVIKEWGWCSVNPIANIDKP